MSNYLERNRELVVEVNDEIKHGLLFDNNLRSTNLSETSYYTAGSYPSAVLNRELYLGYKKYKYRDPRLALPLDLGIIRSIIQVAPNLEVEIPVLNGLLTHIEEGDIGVIVEDVSKGGTERVVEVSKDFGRDADILPDELKRINPYLTDEELANASFLIGDSRVRRRMLLDFNSLSKGVMPSDWNKYWPYKDLSKDVVKHTVFTSQQV